MIDSQSRLVQNFLARPEVHKQWSRDYRTADNETFFEQAFEYILREVNAPADVTILDAGCGSCAHSVRLARRGFNVQAVDFSESALAMAEDYVNANGLDDRISLARESLLELSFPDESFEYALCWGVLMHIPEVDRAVAELSRVIKPGGTLIVSEGNKASLEAVGIRKLRQLLRREKAEIREKPEGLEYWTQKNGDSLVTRQANIGWLIRSFEAHGLTLTRRVAGQFSESYTRLSARPLKLMVHQLNNFWFQHVRLPGPAYGNILFFHKRS